MIPDRFNVGRFHVGRTLLRVSAVGCVSCGTRRAGGWTTARDVEVTVAGKTKRIALPLCAECRARIVIEPIRPPAFLDRGRRS